jgi:segregation and condensation protein B
MHTPDQPNNPPELDLPLFEEMDTNILDEEVEAAPSDEAVQNSPVSTDAAPESEAAEADYEAGDGMAPFEGAADPGIDELEAEEGEEAEEVVPQVYHEYNSTELQAAVEATLFMHQKPVTVNRLRELINPEIAEDDYRTAISNLMAVFFDEARGVELVEVANAFQIRTKGEHKDVMRRIFQITPTKLTNAMLEVLAIVAYNQPLTREGVDKIRGVDSSHLLRVLLDKKMLRIAGKSDTVGNPMIYATTKEFLELFGLRDLTALPTLRELEEMLPKNEVGNSISEEEALASEMEVIVAASKPVEFNDLEVEGWEDDETPKKSDEPRSAAEADRDASTPEHGSAEIVETDRDNVDQPSEAAGREPAGQEGNA